MRSLSFTANGESFDLPLIAEGGYASEYLFRSSTSEIRLRIRHSKEKVTPGAQQYDRHNVEITVTDFPTTQLPNGRVSQAYVVLRGDTKSDGTSARDALIALIGFLGSPGTADGLVKWQSDFSGSAGGGTIIE